MKLKKTMTCPHCGSSLTVDTEAGVVVSHEPPVHQSEKVDLRYLIAGLSIHPIFKTARFLHQFTYCCRFLTG